MLYNEGSMMTQCCFNDSMMARWWFNDDPMTIQWWSNDVSMMIQLVLAVCSLSPNDDSMTIQWWFSDAALPGGQARFPAVYDSIMLHDFPVMMLQWWLNVVSKMVQWWFNDGSKMVRWWFNDDSMRIPWWSTALQSGTNEPTCLQLRGADAAWDFSLAAWREKKTK